MFVRRGQAVLRLGAGLVLALTCAAAPAVVTAQPAAGAPVQCAEDAAPRASATSTELGGTVEVHGDCFPMRDTGTIEIFIQGNEDSRMQQKDVSTGGGQSVHASFTPEVDGKYQAVIEMKSGQSATASFEVLPVEEPPEEEPTDPPTTDPEPTDPEPTDPEPSEPAPTDPTDPPASDEPTEDPTDPPTTDEPTDPPATEEPTQGSSDDPSASAPTSPEPGAGDPGAGDQQQPPPSSGADDDVDSPAPSAGERTDQPSQSPEPPADPDPGSDKGDAPAVPEPAHTPEQKRAAALAVLMTSLFAHGVSDGEVGLSPDEVDAELRKLDGDTGEDSASGGGGTTADGSDSEGAADEGEDELAETGTDVTAPAALAGISLLGGAGLLWHQRRRRD